MKKTKKLNSKKEKKFSIVYLLIWFPLIDFLTSYFAWEGKNIWIGSVVKGILFLVAIFSLLKNKNERKYILFLGIYFLLNFIFISYHHLSIVDNLSLLLKTFLLPILLLYFSTRNDEKVNEDFLVKIFYFYLLLLVIPKFLNLGHNISEIYENKDAYLSFFYSGNELSGTLLCLLPFVLIHLKENKNILVKLLGSLLIVIGFALLKTKTLLIGFIITLIYLFWKNKKRKTNYFVVIPVVVLITILSSFILWNNFHVALEFYEIDEPKEVFQIEFLDKVLLSSRITYLDNVDQIYQKESLGRKIFGLGDLTKREIKNVELDIFDIYYSLGLLGFVVYILLFIHSFKSSKLKGVYRFSFILLLIVANISGHILTSAMVSIWLSTFSLANKNEKKEKKILLVSNMYPSKKFKHYGVFVENMVYELKDLGFKVYLSVMPKQKNILIKIIYYAMFYLKTSIMLLFGSYDYIYVHFISHSSRAVLPFIKFYPKTKLILNAHGNDVVKDYNFEEENIIESRKAIKESDLVVCPSNYFKEKIANDYNYPLDKIIVYPSSGVNLEVFKPISKKEAKENLGLSLDYNYFGYVSRIEKNKGYDTLLEAIYLLKEEEFMKKTKLIIIGTGEETDKLNSLIKLYGLEDYIIKKDFVFQKDLALYYNAFDLFIFPTKRESESLGLVGLEAMACKTFVIGCDLYGPKEYLKDNVNSYTFHDVKTGKELARKIIKYNKLDEKDKKKILDNALDTAKEFSNQNTKKILKEIFGEV